VLYEYPEHLIKNESHLLYRLGELNIIITTLKIIKKKPGNPSVTIELKESVDIYPTVLSTETLEERRFPNLLTEELSIPFGGDEWATDVEGDGDSSTKKKILKLRISIGCTNLVLYMELGQISKMESLGQEFVLLPRTGSVKAAAHFQIEYSFLLLTIEALA
jgi:hypothetical protein